MKLKLSDPSVLDVALEDVDADDYLYFVDAQTKVTYRLRHSVLLAWVGANLEIEGGGGAPDAHAASHATGGADPITPAGIGAIAIVMGADGEFVLFNGAGQVKVSGLTLASLQSVIAEIGNSITATQATANAALPKPGGTTTANGIAYGTGTAGSAVAISTTTIADLVKRLGNVFTLTTDTVLDDSHSGSIIFTDTSGGARSHTIPTTVGAGWNAVFVREGANTLNIIGDGTMLMAGPAAAANAVAIAVDNGGVSVIRRSATKCWCAGKIS